MIDLSVFRRLRVFGIGLLGFIACVEILRAGLAVFLYDHHLSAPLTLVPLFSALVLLVAIALYAFVFEPAYRSVRDLTAQLDRKHRHAAAIVDSDPDALVIFDEAGRVTRMNEAALDLLGVVDPSALALDDLVVPAGRATFGSAFALARAGSRLEINTIWKTAEGGTVPLLAMVSPIETFGNITGVVASLRDQTAVQLAEDGLRRGEERFRSIFEHHPDAAVAIGRDGRYLYVNVAMERLSGYRGEELIGGEMRLTPPEYVGDVQSALRRGLAGETFRFSIQLLRKDGSRPDVTIDIIPMYDHDGISGVYAFVKDVTAAKLAGERERRQLDRFRAISVLAGGGDVAAAMEATLRFACATLEADAANVGLIHDDAITFVHGAGDAYHRGIVVPLAHSFSRHIFGSREVLVVRDALVEPWASDAAAAWQRWRSYVSATIFIGGVPSGVLAFVSNRPRAEFDDADRDFVAVIASLVGSALERERREHQLSEMAFIDSLTSLPNRAYLNDQLELALAHARRYGGSFALQYVDLDGFKHINDTMGHQAGDQVLSVIAARIKMAVRDSEIVARIGGDEFVVLQSRIDSLEAITRLGSRLVDAAAEPIVIRDEIVRLGASVGVSRFPGDAQTAEGLMRCADEAMYRAKRAGRNRLEMYA